MEGGIWCCDCSCCCAIKQNCRSLLCAFTTQIARLSFETFFLFSKFDPFYILSPEQVPQSVEDTAKNNLNTLFYKWGSSYNLQGGPAPFLDYNYSFTFIAAIIYLCLIKREHLVDKSCLGIDLLCGEEVQLQSGGACKQTNRLIFDNNDYFSATKIPQVKRKWR